MAGEEIYGLVVHGQSLYLKAAQKLQSERPPDELMSESLAKFVEDSWFVRSGKKGLRFVHLDHIFESRVIIPPDSRPWGNPVKLKKLRIDNGSVVVDCTPMVEHELQLVFSADLKLQKASVDGKPLTGPLPSDSVTVRFWQGIRGSCGTCQLVGAHETRVGPEKGSADISGKPSRNVEFMRTGCAACWV